MRRPTTTRLATLATAAAVVALGLFASSTAAAQSIIRSPGDHPDAWELEPHLNLRPFDTPDDDFGLGLGFRARVPIVSNGFVSSINNSVGIGFGFDWLNYRACRRGDCGSVNHFIIPVVMQWNFWLTRSWSVFGEPGLAINFYSSDCDDDNDRNGYVDCHRDRDIDPVLFAGARWHFSQYTTLTMRVGWPYASVGISFLLERSALGFGTAYALRAGELVTSRGLLPRLYQAQGRFGLGPPVTGASPRAGARVRGCARRRAGRRARRARALR